MHSISAITFLLTQALCLCGVLGQDLTTAIQISQSEGVRIEFDPDFSSSDPPSVCTDDYIGNLTVQLDGWLKNATHGALGFSLLLPPLTLTATNDNVSEVRRDMAENNQEDRKLVAYNCDTCKTYACKVWCGCRRCQKDDDDVRRLSLRGDSHRRLTTYAGNENAGGKSFWTRSPTVKPTARPTKSPTPKPTPRPTNTPTPRPTKSPTPLPTPRPTKSPTPQPTPRPTKSPTIRPTKIPTPEPTLRPSKLPTPEPTPRPTKVPTPPPTLRPTKLPTPQPTNRPVPTQGPTLLPTKEPTAITPQPTLAPSVRATPQPTGAPSVHATPQPTEAPSERATPQPSDAPSALTTPQPTEAASGGEPTEASGVTATSPPAEVPSVRATHTPTEAPSVRATPPPTEAPTAGSTDPPVSTVEPTARTPEPTPHTTPPPTQVPTALPVSSPSPIIDTRVEETPAPQPTLAPTVLAQNEDKADAVNLQVELWARQWVADNDSTGCMGNAANLVVIVTFF